MASKYERLTIPYEELDGDEFLFVGEESANVGKMIKAGIPVPPGFAITVHAMDRFVTDSGIRERLTRIFAEVRERSPEAAKEVSDAAGSLIDRAELPADLQGAVTSDYRRLCEGSGIPDCPVAVQPSFPGAAPARTAFYRNVRGERNVLDAARRCWSTAYEIDAIEGRMKRGVPLLLNIGVSISTMMNPRVSGTIVTINPLNGDPSKISIDAGYGLRDAVASGLVTPDTYILDKIVIEPVKTVIGTKEIQYVYSGDGSTIIQAPVPEKDRHSPCLTLQETRELTRIGRLIENLYGTACNIEFGIDPDLPFPKNMTILRVKPESFWSRKQAIPRTEKRKDALDRMVGQLIAGMKLERESLEHVHRPSVAGHAGCCPLCTLRSLAR